MASNRGQGDVRNSPVGIKVPAMGTFEDGQRLGRNGTDLPSFHAVQDAVPRLVRKQWSGWSVTDQQDLAQLVMVKYFGAFGRDRLPDDNKGKPAVPIAWLIKVIRNAGVDYHRYQEARPADPVDFGGPDAYGLERLVQAVNPQPSLASQVANNIDVQNKVRPALEALAAAYPMDAKLIVWRFIQDRDIQDLSLIRGTSSDATKKALQRAMKRLRESIVSITESQPV